MSETDANQTDTTNAAPTTAPVTATTRQTFVQPIVALPDRKFFIKRMVISAAVMIFAAFFLYDGFVRYPSHNAARAQMVADQMTAEKTHDDAKRIAKEKEIRDYGNAKSEFDIHLQKIIGFALLPVGLFLLIKFVKESKGELRLDGDVLYAPRHPPVPVTSITGVENGRWEKKGIALFDYRLADGTAGRIKIDDFIFDRPPTDAIHDELIAKMPKSEEV